MKIEKNKLTASPGKILRRKSDEYIVGNEIYWGYTYPMNAEILEEPLLEIP